MTLFSLCLCDMFFSQIFIRRCYPACIRQFLLLRRKVILNTKLVSKQCPNVVVPSILETHIRNNFSHYVQNLIDITDISSNLKKLILSQWFSRKQSPHVIIIKLIAQVKTPIFYNLLWSIKCTISPVPIHETNTGIMHCFYNIAE